MVFFFANMHVFNLIIFIGAKKLLDLSISLSVTKVEKATLPISDALSIS